ncbi:InlB B-repeat-containing protein, partial [Gottfriedia sp. NPDC057948]|uniref:InlB B-repeat-containing protein n=1 Tax=Gottfriedia sp. NPDC057948 TaxID=3346287 RepID=UPI0036D9FFBD
TANYNTTIAMPSFPTKTGYTFIGWYKDAAGQVAWNFATDKVTEDTVLYAKWSINKYSVKFDSQGGSTVADLTANYNTTIAMPSFPTKTGYTFIGWYKDAAGQVAWNFATDKVTEDTVLYAKWSINKYSVKFDSQGGSTVADLTANYNTTIAMPSFPAKTGYTFIGWYKDAAGQVAWNFETDKVTSNVTLYAKWILNAPVINLIDENDTKITGTTLANATITVKINDVVIATGKADSKGIFSIKIKQQKVGTELSVYAKDSTGNESSATKVKVVKK